jgi:VanZ family protein
MRWLGDWALAGAAMAAIFAVSSIPNLTSLPGDLSDKVGHFGAYAVLGGIVLRAVAHARWDGVTGRTAWRAWAVAAAYGLSDEFHQRFVPGRTAALDDWGADALGAATAVVIIGVAAVGRRLERTAGPPRLVED